MPLSKMRVTVYILMSTKRLAEMYGELAKPSAQANAASCLG
ncbi:hypothetical protein AVEN_25750-1, partial [Araneus ventricosus]